MLTIKKPYGYCYDKKGNLIEVSYPVKEDLTTVNPHTEVVTGKIGSGVGFSMSAGNEVRR